MDCFLAVKESLSAAVVNKEFGLVLIHRCYNALFFQIADTCTTDVRVVAVVGVSLHKILGRTLNCKMNEHFKVCLCAVCTFMI